MANGLMSVPAPGAMPGVAPTPHFQQAPQPPAPGVGAAPMAPPAGPAFGHPPVQPPAPQQPAPQQPQAQMQTPGGFQGAPQQPQMQTPGGFQGAPQQAQMAPPPYENSQFHQQNPQYAPAPSAPQAPARPFFESVAAEPAVAAQPAPDATSFAQQVAQQLQAAQQPAADPYAVAVPEVDLTAWEQHRPAVNRMIAEALNEHIAPKFGQVARQVQEVSGIRGDLDGLRQQTYESSIRAAIPDVDGVANTPEFQQYRNTVLPGGVTVDALMRSAHKGRNAAAMIDVFRGFERQRASTQQAQPQYASNGFAPQAQQYTQPHVSPGAALYPGASAQQGISAEAAASVLDRYARGHATEAEYLAVEAALAQQGGAPAYQ